jgi:phosphate-selective porin OprO/OprP
MSRWIHKLVFRTAACLVLISGATLYADDAEAPADAEQAPSLDYTLPVTNDSDVDGEGPLLPRLQDHSLWKFEWDDGIDYSFRQTNLLARRAAHRQDTDIEPLRGRIGFRVHVDAVDYDADESLEGLDDTVDIRRLRLYTQGDFFFIWPASFKIEADYTDSEFFWRETFVSFTHPFLNRHVKLGHFRAPMSIEAYGGGRAATFMEHAAPVQAFQPGIKYGVEASGWSRGERLTYAIGWFADGEDSDIGESSTSFTRGIGRVTGLPYYADHGKQLIHLGLGGHYLFSDESEIRYRGRPESRFASYVVDTGGIEADQSMLWGLEAAAVHGAYSLQAEAFQTTVFSADENELVFYGAYLQASWVITGETRPYDKTSGTFQIVQPATPFSISKASPGAWELGLRLSRLDLSDKDILGGELNMMTAGLNWYLSSHLRIMFNYGHGDVRGTTQEGDVDIFQSRVQVDF